MMLTLKTRTIKTLCILLLAAGCERETFLWYTEGVWARSPQPPDDINKTFCQSDVRATGAHWVMLILDVRSDGSVASVAPEGVTDSFMRTVKTTPAVSTCVSSVVATVRATKFRPAETKDGKPAAARVRMGVTFTIHKS
jgi:hypothetical protein